MSFTVKELEEKLNQLVEENYDGWFGELAYSLEHPAEGEEVILDGFGKLEFVEDFGGEGMGDEQWVVFKIGDRYFRQSGFYSSWGESDWDAALEEVKPVQVEVTQYKTVKES